MSSNTTFKFGVSDNFSRNTQSPFRTFPTFGFVHKKEETPNKEANTDNQNEKKKTKATTAGEKLKKARLQANEHLKEAEAYATEVEAYMNSLYYISFEMRIAGLSARSSVERAKAAVEAVNKATTLRQANKFVKEAASAAYVAHATKKMMEEDKKKFPKNTSNQYCKSDSVPSPPKTLSDEEQFEVDVFKWFKSKSFDDAVRGIRQFIDNEKVQVILDNLEHHKDTKKAYKELSRLFHPDTLYKQKNITDFEKFKYITMMKVLNAAKACSSKL